MLVVVTTPTGHIGKAVARHVLDAGVEVRLLARYPEKLSDLADRGAEVWQGTLDDEKFVARVTRGADALFWVTPPCYDSKDLKGIQIRIGRSAAEAIRTNRIARVVNISSVGAHLASGVGPITGLHEIERILDEAATNITHLRPGFFYENYLWQLDSICSSGSVYFPVAGSTRYPMIATRDIARIAADRLLDAAWTGFWVRELHGAAEISFDQAAALISEAVGVKVVHVRVSPEQAADSMRTWGMSENAVELMLELYQALDSGLLRPAEPRSPETTTPTTLLEFAREVLAPRIRETVAH